MKSAKSIIKIALRATAYAIALILVAIAAVLVIVYFTSPRDQGETAADASSLNTQHVPGPGQDEPFGQETPDAPGDEGADLPQEAQGDRPLSEMPPPVSAASDDDNNGSIGGSAPAATTAPDTGLTGQEDASGQPGETEVNYGDIKPAVDRIAEKYGAAGVQVAVISKGEIAYSCTYGDAEKGVYPMDNNVKIRVASISKVILGMTIMSLVERGELDLDEDIGEYWGAPVRNPSYRNTKITIRHMLSHTSSIIVYDYGFAAGGDLIESRFLDGSCFSRSAPGNIGSWNYNNYAFAALGVTVEHKTDETVNDLAGRYLFEPLGIDAAFGSGSIADTSKLATLYTSGGGIGRSVEAQMRTLGSTYPGERGEEFPGGLTISAYDLAKLIAVLANGGNYGGKRILAPGSVERMQESQGRTSGFDQCLPLRHKTNIYGEDELYYHTGSNYGVYNLISYNPNTGDGVVVLTTGASGKTDANGIYAICGEISEFVYRLGGTSPP